MLSNNSAGVIGIQLLVTLMYLNCAFWVLIVTLAKITESFDSPAPVIHAGAI